MELSGIDLNLLVALEALLDEKNVTRAGKRIGLTQSATSHALGRLRELLDDPLLIRSGHGMRRTALGERLAVRLPPLLESIRETLFEFGRDFDPASSEREFAIATNDYVVATVFGDVIEEVSRQAPGVNLRIRELDASVVQKQLAAGELDLAIGTLRVPEGLCCERLFEDGFTCLVRNEHPTIGARMTLKRYVETPHILISSPSEGPGIVDYRLAELDLSRRVALRLPHFMIAPALVAQSDYVLTMATRLAKRLASRYDLRCLKPPIEIPSFPVAMVWDQRADGDPGLTWLKEIVAKIARVQRDS
jgi:DNA-binding transcriptional LysR family regulator